MTTENATELVGGGEYISDVVFVVMGMLLLGVITRHLFQRLPVPYTVLLLFWGLISGGVAAYSSLHDTGWHQVNIGLETLGNISPDGLLLIFMPILIYGSAQAMDWHTVKKEFWQVLIMATSGVIVSMCLTAVFIYYVFPFGWTWYQCFLMGALISATDPVAVVALLKDVGASKRLGTIIEGESLLNDGSAFVLFLIFLEYVRFNSCCTVAQPSENLPACEDFNEEGHVCEPFTPGEAAVLFVQLTVGGPASGIMFGILLVTWLTFVYNDEIVEIFITIAGAYITFYVSEDIFHVSGVLSIVALGFFMAAFGRSKISPRVLHPLETVWEMLEWGGNTIIFILAGVIITQQLVPLALEATDAEQSDISTWIGYGVLLYVACIVIRFISVFLHWPLLKLIGYGMTWQEAVVISWSGLRGAIGLALALIVNLDTAISKDLRFQVLLWTSEVVILSLVVNGTSTKALLYGLKILAPQPVKVEFLIHSLNEMEEYAEKHCSHLKTDPLIGNPDWNQVLALSGIDAASLIDSKFLDKDGGGSEEDKRVTLKGVREEDPEEDTTAPSDVKVDVDEAMQLAPQPESADKGRVALMGAYNIKQTEVLEDVRARLLHGVKSIYGEGFHKGYISPSQSLELINSVDVSLDRLDHAIRDWEVLEKNASLGDFIVRFQGITWCGPLQALPEKWLFEALEHGLVLANSYVYAHKQTRERMQASFDDLADADGFDAETLPLTAKAIEIVIKESSQSAQEAIKFIKALRLSYPEVTRAVKTKLVALTVLHRKGKFVDHLNEGGLIENSDYEKIQKAILQRATRVKLSGWRDGELPSSKKLMHSSPLLIMLDDATFEKEVFSQSHHRLFQPGDHLFRSGDSALSLFVIIRGSTTTEGEDNAGKRTQNTDHYGSVVGVSELLLGLPRFRTVTATNIVEGYEIKAETLAKLMIAHPEVEMVAWRLCAALLSWQHKEPLVATMPHEDRLEWFLRAQVLLPNKDEDIHIVGHTYLIHGALTSVLGTRAITNTPQRTEAPKMLGPNFMHLKAASEFAVLLALPATQRESTVGRDQDILKHHSVQPRAVLNMKLNGRNRNSADVLKRMSHSVIKRRSEDGVPPYSVSHKSLTKTSSGGPRAPSGLARTSTMADQSREQRSMEFMRRLSMGPVSYVPESPGPATISEDPPQSSAINIPEDPEPACMNV